ncbi:MAG: cation:dicarboxylase symporter family transporter [Spirochaetaceae bacterium]|nr:cation:dicarboxylase symporter family transporter [Spirochaetaceae bacterium]
MDVWKKLLIGSVLGGLLGWFLPGEASVLKVLEGLQEMGLRIGRYMTAPMLVFSLTIAVYELREMGRDANKRKLERLWRKKTPQDGPPEGNVLKAESAGREQNPFGKLILHTFLMMAGVAFFVMLVGIGVIYFAPTIRIPTLAVEQVPIVSLHPLDGILGLFPSNIFAFDGVYLLPLCVFAFFVGSGLSGDRSICKPVVTLVNSLSHIFYDIGAFFYEILGWVMIILSAYWMARYRELMREDTFRSIILLLGVLSAVLGFIVLPLFFSFFGGRKHPWAVLRGSLGPALTGFFSGDCNFTLPFLFQHAKKELGVRRRSNAITLPLFATFCRAGSGMIGVIALVIVIQSYSSLSLKLPDIFFLGFQGFCISWLLARHPGDAAYTALAVLCLQGGKGFEFGYLILKPLGFYLIALGTFLDVMIASFASHSLAKINGFQDDL